MARLLRLLACGACAATLLLGSGVASAEETAAEDIGYSGPKRVEFDDRLIKGQTAKAGAVYIYNRQKSELYSLVSKRRIFRPRTVRAVLWK